MIELMRLTKGLRTTRVDTLGNAQQPVSRPLWAVSPPLAHLSINQIRLLIRDHFHVFDGDRTHSTTARHVSGGLTFLRPIGAGIERQMSIHRTRVGR